METATHNDYKITIKVLVADEVWVATALLHRENPTRLDFTVKEIIDRAAAEGLAGPPRESLSAHVYSHCVANRRSDGHSLRMLFATGTNTRRLYRAGDATDPKRGGKIIPADDALPSAYRNLLDWYANEYAKEQNRWLGGLFEMAGAGKGLLGKTDPDEYVRSLRENWE